MPKSPLEVPSLNLGYDEGKVKEKKRKRDKDEARGERREKRAKANEKTSVPEKPDEEFDHPHMDQRPDSPKQRPLSLSGALAWAKILIFLLIAQVRSLKLEVTNLTNRNLSLNAEKHRPKAEGEESGRIHQEASL